MCIWNLLLFANVVKKNFVLVFEIYFNIVYILIFTYDYYCMSDKLSVLVLNAFSDKNTSNDKLFQWLKKYWLEIHWWVKHFMRELWVWKTLRTDKEILIELFEWGEKSKFMKMIKECCKKNTAFHFIFPLEYFELYYPFLEKWNLNNKVFLHVVYNDVQEDLEKIEKIEKLVDTNKNIVIGSLANVDYVFNQKNNWRDLQKWYDEIWFFQLQTSFTASEYLKKCLSEEKTVIDPVSFIDSQAIEDWDICFIGEIDQEKIAAVTKVFDVSKDESLRIKFNNFNPIFITKQLPNLELFVVKSPYSLYHNHVLIEKEHLSTLPEKFSNGEIRMIQIWDKEHLKLLNKYFNNERGVVYDWHKKVRCEDKFNETWELAVSANELILKRFSDEFSNYEISFLSFEDEGGEYVWEYLDIVRQNWIDVIVVSIDEDVVYSTIDFSKKNLNWEILSNVISEKFWV